MRIFVLALGIVFALAAAVSPSLARHYPCSGKKGGVSHCQGSTFVCNDGSVSASKKNCEAYYGRGSALGLTGAQAPSSEMQPTYSGDCPCRSGAYCIGPRGGRYCYTDSGNKSYLRR